MSLSHLTTVQAALVETIRIVECASMRDSTEIGEEIARFPAGTSLDTVRAELVRLAMENRGVDYSADVFCNRGIWERFASVCYRSDWEIEPETGIILSGRNEVLVGSISSSVERDRAIFEHERKKRTASHNRAAGRTKKAEITAENH